MRIGTVYLLFALSSLLTAQTSQELHGRYGEPQRESFTARPGIAVTVAYGSDGMVCEMLLEPLKPLLREPKPDVFMSSEAVTEVLAELVPLDSRGPHISDMLSNSGCNQVRVTEYVLVSITRATHQCLPLKPEREMQATVTFRRNSCRNELKRIGSE